MYETHAGDDLQYTINYTALVFSRGGQMQSSSIPTGEVSLRSPTYPGLDSSAYYYLAHAFSPDLQGRRTGGSGEEESTSAREIHDACHGSSRAPLPVVGNRHGQCAGAGLHRCQCNAA